MIPLHHSLTLTVDEVTAISVQLMWTAVSPVTEYRVEYRLMSETWSDARNTTTERTSTNVQGLTPNTGYVVRVIVLNNCTQQVSMEQSFNTRGGCSLNIMCVYMKAYVYTMI